MQTNSGISFDDSKWPIVVVTIGPSTNFAQGVIDVGMQFDEWFSKKKPFFDIFDLSEMNNLPRASDRSVLGDYLKSHVELFKTLIVGEAYVSTSAVARGAITAVGWLQQRPYKNKIFSSIEDATVWGNYLLNIK